MGLYTSKPVDNADESKLNLEQSNQDQSNQDQSNQDQSNQDQSNQDQSNSEQRNTKYTPEYFMSEEIKELHQIEKSKQSLDYNGIVFEGGGTKGVAYCGAIKVLEEFKITEKLWRYAGSSIGAIIAILMAVDYNSDEITTIVNNIDFNSFLDNKNGIIRESYQLINKLGLCQGKNIYDFLGEIIYNKTKNADYTFGELWENNKKELVITATDMCHNKTVFFSYKTYPNMSIRNAGRASTSIPYLYVPFEMDNMLLADGGIKDNYPIHVFDGNDPDDKMAEHNLTSMNSHILGFRLITDKELKDTIEGTKIDSLKKLTMTLINNIYTIQEEQFIRPGFSKRTVSILTPNIQLTDFDITNDQKEELIKSGEECTYQFFRSTIVS
jgi:NTE family protein